MQEPNKNEMLTKVKEALRISEKNTAYDNEITDLIEACKSDLLISGISSSFLKGEDPLIKQAIKTYCKAYFGYDNPDSEKLKESYSLLKQHLAIAYSKENEKQEQVI